MKEVFRVKGYDSYQIGDKFKVPKKAVYNPHEDALQELVKWACDEPSKAFKEDFDLYIRLPEGDKIIERKI